MGHKYKLEKAEAFKLEDNIIENVIKDSAFMDVGDVRALKSLNLEIAGTSSYGLLVETGDNTSITKEARELIATSDEFSKLTIAKAVILNNLSQKILANFYLTVNKPKIKTKMFNDREKALEWLRLQVAEFEAAEQEAQRP